jgi:16S rRNA (cytosine1402-N4)-methyltransferase
MHKSVLLKEVIEYLNPQSNQNFIDCTLGGGGHTKAILESTAPCGKVLGIDLDPAAVKTAQILNSKYEIRNRLVAVEGNFKNLKKIVAENNFGPVHGILLDLGFRSEQLENKGMSFLRHEILDMRFGPSVGDLTAREIVNAWPEKDLADIFKKYGEEKNAALIAGEIISARKIKPIIYSDQLAEVILGFYRKKFKTKKEIPWIGGLHPATRVFQALRIAVNGELENLKSVLPQATEILEPHGRLCVISFHSLEDRIVKHYFKHMSSAHGFPTNYESKRITNKLKILTKKPITPSEEETQQNPRSRSAKLRAAEKLNSV